MTHYDSFIKEAWAIPGLYKIINTQTKRFYLGESGNIGARVHGHLERLRGNCHSVKLFQSEYNAYGVEAFCFEVVQEEADTERRLALELSMATSNLGLLYSTFIRGQVSSSLITAEQVEEVCKLRRQGLSWPEVALQANQEFGYSYSDGHYRQLAIKRDNSLGMKRDGYKPTPYSPWYN